VKAPRKRPSLWQIVTSVVGDVSWLVWREPVPEGLRIFAERGPRVDSRARRISVGRTDLAGAQLRGGLSCSYFHDSFVEIGRGQRRQRTVESEHGGGPEGVTLDLSSLPHEPDDRAEP